MFRLENNELHILSQIGFVTYISSYLKEESAVCKFCNALNNV